MAFAIAPYWSAFLCLGKAHFKSLGLSEAEMNMTFVEYSMFNVHSNKLKSSV